MNYTKTKYSEVRRVFYLISQASFNINEVASFFSVDVRTIKRDIYFIRNETKYDIIYNRKDNIYTVENKMISSFPPKRNPT